METLSFTDKAANWHDAVRKAQAFNQFQEYALSLGKLTVKTHTQHIFSLSSIFLIKYQRNHPDIGKYLEPKHMDLLIDFVKRDRHFGDLDYGLPSVSSDILTRWKKLSRQCDKAQWHKWIG
ncbi:hypothetical protein DM01DRAFT_47406 [Hesseltinella vesiculosa]|uniref:Uncharacterized protein n=1 Tax=Hesseltinella vesiculosa TaxID=101127 RepID=A0A1X2GFB1_9FUNG|nr:hypothetical protein DM01DRAFT_47406 [Hesseltinella vesiculosa]